MKGKNYFRILLLSVCSTLLHAEIPAGGYKRKALFEDLKAPNLNPWTNKQLAGLTVVAAAGLTFTVIFVLRKDQTKAQWDIILKIGDGAKSCYVAAGSIPYAPIGITIAGIMYISPFCKRHIDRILRYLWSEYYRISNSGKGYDTSINISHKRNPVFLDQETDDKMCAIWKSIANGNGGVHLFAGPPGTGKTESAVTLACSLGCNGEMFEANNFNFGGFGAVSENINQNVLARIKSIAANEGNAFIVINEIDTYQRQENKINQNTQTKGMMSFISECEEYNRQGKGQITLIMTSNAPLDIMDDAVLSRCNNAIKFPEINQETMFAILYDKITKKVGYNPSETNKVIHRIEQEIGKGICKDARRIDKIIGNIMIDKNDHAKFTDAMINGLREAGKAKA
jgi:hypothetical protein